MKLGVHRKITLLTKWHSSDLTATYATHFATSFSNFSPRKEKGYNMKIFMCYVPRSCFLSGFFFTNIRKSLHSRGKGGGGVAICSTPLCHFHWPHRHLDISRVITSEGSSLQIHSGWTRTENLWLASVRR